MTSKNRAVLRETDAPSGELILRTRTQLSEMNTHGTVFGGWVMWQLDNCAGMAAGVRARGAVVTASVTDLEFLRPVPAGSILEGYAHLNKVGRTSMHYTLELWTRDVPTNEASLATRAKFLMVAIDEAGRPRPVPHD